MEKDIINLKISTKSEAGKIAGAIAELIKENNKRIDLTAVGAGAINQAVKGIAIARGYVAPAGINLVCVPAFIEVQIENENRTGMKFIVKEEI